MRILDRLFRMGLRHGWRRGVVEGDPVWVAVGGVALLGYLARRVLPRSADVVFLEKLNPGQSIRITHEGTP
jgi:hypothetical protein